MEQEKAQEKADMAAASSAAAEMEGAGAALLAAMTAAEKQAQPGSRAEGQETEDITFRAEPSSARTCSRAAICEAEEAR